VFTSDPLIIAATTLKDSNPEERAPLVVAVAELFRPSGIQNRKSSSDEATASGG
jgi:hypothetical protein